MNIKENIKMLFFFRKAFLYRLCGCYEIGEPKTLYLLLTLSPLKKNTR